MHGRVCMHGAVHALGVRAWGLRAGGGGWNTLRGCERNTPCVPALGGTHRGEGPMGAGGVHATYSGPRWAQLLPPPSRQWGPSGLFYPRQCHRSAATFSPIAGSHPLRPPPHTHTFSLSTAPLSRPRSGALSAHFTLHPPHRGSQSRAGPPGAPTPGDGYSAADTPSRVEAAGGAPTPSGARCTRTTTPGSCRPRLPAGGVARCCRYPPAALPVPGASPGAMDAPPRFL